MVCRDQCITFDILNDSGFVAYLLGSRFHEDVPSMTEKFDKTTKLSFRDPSDPQYVKFGTARDRDPSLGIRAGQLKLDGRVFQLA